MAQLHNELRKGTLSDAVKRALGVTRSEGGVERFGETVTPILNPWGMPEWAYLRGETLWSCKVLVAAVVGELGIFGVGLPANSPFLLTVEGAGAKAAAASAFLVEHLTRATIAATAVQGNIASNRDQRYAAPGLVIRFIGAIETWTGTDAGTLGTTQEEITPPAAGEYGYYQSMPYLVKPGGVLAFQATTLNTATDFNVWGRLRAAYPGELV